MMDQIKKLFDQPMNIILVGALITVIGGFIGGVIAAVGAYKQNKNSSEKTSRIDKNTARGVQLGETTEAGVLHLKKQNIDLLSKVSNQEEIIDSLRKENIEIYRELRDANKIIISNQRGGEEPISIDVSSVNGNDFICFIVNTNKYSVRSLNIEVTNYADVIEFCSIKKHTNGKYVANTKCFHTHSGSLEFPEIPIGNYGLSNEFGFDKKLGLVGISDREYSKFQIRFFWLGKAFHQQLICRRYKGVIYTKSRFFVADNLGTTNTSYEQIEVNTARELKPELKSWEVDFDKEFPYGIIDLLADV